VQFGFEQAGPDDNLTATLKPRNASTFEYLSVPPVQVPFRAGAPGVVDIQRLEGRLKPIVGSGAADGLDSSEYALQLVRFPFRQVFGDTDEPPVTIVFKPTVTYKVLVDQVFTKGGR
jgi:hypothetical protein